MVLGEVIDFKVYAIKKLLRFTADLLVFIIIIFLFFKKIKK